MSYVCLKDEMRKARKMHKCIWCGQSIHKGDTYNYERSIFEGQHQSHHWHPECVEAMREMAGNEAAHECTFDAYHEQRPVPQHNEQPKHG